MTGNLAWGEFVHFTARPVDGASDPSLHAHMVVFNATHDPEEDRWKAAQFRWLKADAPYWQAGFHARLAANLETLGYATERRGKHWDVACVARPTVEKFSQRTAQIERVAAEEGIVSPQAKARLGQTTREKKDKEQPWHQLVAGWKQRLTAAERQSLEQACWQAVHPRAVPADADRASVRHAAEHLFTRKSVVGYRDLLAEALRHGVGRVSVAGVQREAGKLDLILNTESGRLKATRQQVLAEEKRLKKIGRDGRGTKSRLGKRGGGGTAREELSADQRKALDALLASTGFITLFEAPAGTRQDQDGDRPAGGRRGNRQTLRRRGTLGTGQPRCPARRGLRGSRYAHHAVDQPEDAGAGARRRHLCGRGGAGRCANHAQAHRPGQAT